tara:strand:- start:135 stop:704 length:570 start_codon:yes stop_codon:yes gene_type:complete
MAQALPFIAAGAAVLGTGIAMAGAQRQGNVATQLFNRRAEQLKINKTLVEQDVEQETSAESLRRELIAREGAQQRGSAKVALAGNNVLLEPGDTAFDLLDDINAETRFKMLLSTQKSESLKRNLRIQADTLEGNIGAARFEAKEARSAANIQTASTALTGASSFASRFDVSGGQFKFRTFSSSSTGQIS